ncbi:SpvB/TcaC N-terminal domain-containing protein [Sorangium sp. So ce1153]|uniref:SpvB/TcaC N-terminal domain-containing protein n=1 Tax=Sorangium sp. So ce1153 TaxID=3133333 RepID=UPI003F5D827D
MEMVSPNKTAGRTEGEHTPTPSISLPKGGGAIRGIGEKFTANPVSGTGSMSLPIAISPGRSGFGPQLSLTYDSGAGNGPFGFSWSLGMPQITRKTDKGLPRYRDAEESDVFILSGAEDLVPLLTEDGSRFADTTSAPGYTIHRYRPRVEGLFARIERWTRQTDGDVHWRSISRDNILTLYGKDANARVADPTDPLRVFTWLICETRDDRGNAVIYEYKPEDGVGVDLARACERNRGGRDDLRRTANRYIKRIRYGNRVPLLDSAGERPRWLTAMQIQDAGWMFEVVFDYGEHDADTPGPDDPGAWLLRSDAFASYRAGFEVRTSRLCRRILMFHHFTGEAGVGDECLVRSTNFTYSHDEDPASARNPVYTFLRAVTQTGYRKREGGYTRRSLPPVEYEYTQPQVQDTLHEVDAANLENLPAGLDGINYRWIDLHGEGVPGVLVEEAGAWFYKRNWSPLGGGRARLGPSELVAAKPNVALAGGATQIMDLAGDGQPDVVVLNGPAPGFYEHDDEEGWKPFRPFTSRLHLDADDPNLRFVDLDGDGRAEALISEDDAFVWHASLGEEGFGPARRVHQALDEEKGPRLVFADGTQSIYLADVSGDGLTDLVRIRNGEVCYWPNLGHGRFGAKITMDHAPHFDHPVHFDQSRIRLADIDGSGTTDIIYLHRDGVRLYFNQAGNGWSAPQRLRVFPRIDELASIVVIDLLGNGTACLVWSSPLPSETPRQMRYVDLMGGKKPHLLVKAVNNLGAETHVDYAPSTKFYLRDKHEGKPWLTRLPFPVHVVERVETRDRISGNRFVTRYAYHHGYFDGEEREFRGFGMVEQWDTEEFAALAADSDLSQTTNLDVVSHVPPLLTRTWFHTGVHVGGDHVSDFFAGLLDWRDRGEYYREPGLTDAEARRRLLPDTVLPAGLTMEEAQEARRALKGAMLRQEVYALDGAEKADIPYTVVEQNFTVVRLQSLAGNRHAVFFTHSRESLQYHYERNSKDPRVTHALTLEVDEYGNVLRSVAIAYGRRTDSTDPALTAADLENQGRSLITWTENRFTNAERGADHHRAPVPAETRTYEVTGLTPEGGTARFCFDEWTREDFALLRSAAEIPYEDVGDHATRQKRLVEHARTLYRRDDLAALSPLGQVERLALPGETYKLALTPGLLAHVFKRRRAGQPDECLLLDPAALLEGKAEDQGGYFWMDGGWWIPSGRAFFDPQSDVADPARSAARELLTARRHFYLPRKMTDAFGHSTVVDYDPHDLLVIRVKDALDNTVTAENDYRVLHPRLLTDPNRNRTAAAFDTLGMVVATAVMGKEGEFLGDLIDDVELDPALPEVQAFLASPEQRAASLLGKATTRIVYDLDRYRRAGQPPLAATLARESHVHELLGAQSKIQVSIAYSDGFGREIQKKVQAEPGNAPERTETVVLPTGDVRPGDLARDARGKLVQSGATRRWIGSGRTVFNNKGKPVKQYEPFFSATHLFEPEREMTDTGVSAVLFYDPALRVIARLHPNHTYEKVVFGPWHQTTFDVNDTIAARGGQTGDPRTDPDVAGFVREYFTMQARNWRTWYGERIDGQMGPAEREAAQKANVHADTPTTAHFDALGRPFATVAHNRYARSGAVMEDSYVTRVELDIKGNQRAVIDAKGRVVMRYDYDLSGTRVHQANMDAGERWTLNDAAGKTVRAWDSRRFVRRMAYDELRRPACLYVTEEGTERLAERTVYGEGVGDGKNHRTRVYRVFDGAGIVTSEAYDFKGNLLESRRDLLPGYAHKVDWQQSPAANDGSFTERTTYDALNRPYTSTAPDGSVYRATFNKYNLLEKVDVRLRGGTKFTPFVTGIDYNARSQRERIAYGNGARTIYDYDPLTFRLRRLRTTRSSGFDGVASQLFRDAAVVQHLRYTYDPAGNLTQIEDAALQAVFHDGQRVEAVGRYTYDALYRLIVAHGREHIGQTAYESTADGNRRDHPFAGHRAHPNDSKALRNYTEQYEYDAVGNFQVLRHLAGRGGWTRRYDYEEDSVLETGKKNNRLTRMALSDGGAQFERYAHDAHGNIVAMPHLAAMVWDFKDQLRQVDLGGGGTAYYVYDAAGQRVRKVIASQSGNRLKERIYIGGFEVYREYSGDGATVTGERESLHIMDDKQRIALVDTQTVEDCNRTEAALPLQRYQLSNHLGSASLELAADGKMISYEEYHSYGTTALQIGRGTAEVSPKRYRYTGKERDEETGFNHHGARYYAPWVGRWVSADPAGMVDGTNLYAYTRDNPLLNTDPSGTQCEPTVQSCIDPTLPTPREETLQRSLPNEERYSPLPPEPDIMSPASNTSAPEPQRPVTQHDNGTVGEPGLLESLIPIWGSGRSAIHHFQGGNWGRATLYTALAVTDVFLVKSLVTAAGKLFAKTVGEAAMKEATEIAARNVGVQAGEEALAREASSSVVHLTTPEARTAIEGAGDMAKVGSKWGVFALDASRVPTSQLGRNVATLVPGSLAGEVRIGAEGAKWFGRPPLFGLFSGARRFAGVRMTPLGSVNLKTGEFVGGEIFKRGAFRMATRGEYAGQLAHQWLLDYGIDSLIYGGAKVGVWTYGLEENANPQFDFNDDFGRFGSH